MNADHTPVIVSATRTPIGKYLGGLAPLRATELGAIAIREAVKRAGIEPSAVDDVIMGHVLQGGTGQAPARQAALGAGLPGTVPAVTINKVCGSGLKAVMLAAQAIKAGDGDLFVAGGMESLSNAPHLIRGRRGLGYGHQALTDALLYDALWDPFEEWNMGMAAEHIADEFEVTREAMDRWALASHQKAVAAAETGRFDGEIVPLEIPQPHAGPAPVRLDETTRPDTSLEKLAALPPVFKEGGKVTAGNSPGLNDGAAALLVASRERAESLGAAPMARIVGYAGAAVPPKQLFIAPAYAIPKLLQRIGWTLKDVDLIELNEAFAAQVLADGYALADEGWDWDKVNVHGGAISLGHPLGASGARILTTLVHALRARAGRRGLACLCLGGGEAIAMAVEAE